MPRNKTLLMNQFSKWLDEELMVREEGDRRGLVAVSLTMLENLKSNFNLDPGDHLTEKGGQVRGLGGPKLSKILQTFGEARVYLAEGGRTSRGSIQNMTALLTFLGRLHFPSDEVGRIETLSSFQSIVFEKVREYFLRKRIDFVFDANSSTCEQIRLIFSEADRRNRKAAVMQYLVGAKLALRFPAITIRNSGFTSADQQAGERGDFQVNDTVFHVTESPSPGLLKKCLDDLNKGLSCYVVVPKHYVESTRIEYDRAGAGAATIVNVEAFISQNLDEIAEFSRKKWRQEFRDLLDLYNKRVAGVESDSSILIEIPTNL